MLLKFRLGDDGYVRLSARDGVCARDDVLLINKYNIKICHMFRYHITKRIWKKCFIIYNRYDGNPSITKENKEESYK